MITAFASVLLATCVVQGQLISTDGLSTPVGVEVVHAATGTVLAVTDPEGRFSVETPDANPVDTVLEFRHEDWFTKIERVNCGAELALPLVPRVYALKSVRFSASRLNPNYQSSPIREESILDVVNLRDAEGGGVSLAQALQQLPGVGAVGRDGLTSAPTIRGLGRDRSLILMEGMRLSSDRGVGPTGSFLDPFLLNDVVVVRGASSVAYGSGAMGGVISTDLGPPGDTPRVSARLAGSTNGDGRLGAARLEGVTLGVWRAAVGGFVRSTEDYAFPEGEDLDGSDAPEGDALNSGFENLGGTLVLERPLAGGQFRFAGVVTSAQDVGRPTTKPLRLDSIDVEDHLLAVARYQKNDGVTRNELTFGYHRPETVNHTERFDSTGAITRVGRTTNESHDVTASGLIERPLESGSWLIGADIFGRFGVDAVEVNDFRLPTPSVEITTLVANARRVDTGVFVGLKRPVGYLGEALLAGRVDWATRAADGQESVNWLSPSLSLSVVKPVNVRWAMTGAIGRSFRAPRIQELYFEGDRPGGSRLANPDLTPETAWSAELGTRWSNGRWSADLGVWGLLADELIVQLPVDAAGDTLRNVNETEGRMAGAELSVRWRDGEHSEVALAYAFIHGENADGAALPDIPSGEVRVFGRKRVWESKGRSADARLSIRAGGAKTPLASGASEKWWSDVLGSNGIGGDELAQPGFARWDAGVSLKVSPNAKIDVSVTNLFDSRYLDRPENSSFPQPGRSLRLELTLTS